MKLPCQIDINTNFNMVLFDETCNYILHELYNFIIKSVYWGTVNCGDWYRIKSLDRKNYKLSHEFGGYFVIGENNFVIFEEEDKEKAKEIALRLLRYYEG